MSDADELRAQVVQAMTLLTDAVIQGTGTVSDLGDTISGLNKAADTLIGSRTYAGQQLESLVALSDQLELILVGSLNADAIYAQGRVRSAIRDIEDYINRSQYHVNNIQKLSAILRMQLLPIVETELNVTLKEVKDIFERWTWSV
jgi:hypothetical protein